MGLRIATNIQSLAAQRALTRNNQNQNQSLERLASGSRINRAGDDAAGLAISEKMKASLRSMAQAQRNANDGVSMVQVAEGALNEVGNILIRMRELSIQAASDTISDTERAYVEKEVGNLKSEIDRISNSTEFNGTKLLNGEVEGALEIQVGIRNNPMLDRIVYDPARQNATVEALGLMEVNASSKEFAQNNLGMLDAAINRVNENRSDLGALQNRLGSTINNLMIYQENLAGANSRIRDTDMAHETSELVKNNILTSSTISVLGQANMNPQAALKLLS